MAALEEEFTLSAVTLGARPDGLLGVEQTDRTDHFLVTDRSRTVILYKVSDQKPLGSWSVKQGQIITCPAVCNFQTGEHIVVHDDKVLRIWNNEDVNLDKVFKATLSAEVHRVHSVQGAEPVVLFRGGAARGLEALLAEPQQKIETVLSDGEVIKWTKFFVVFRHPVIVFITEKDGNHFAYVQMLHSRNLSKYTLLLEQEEKSVTRSFTASVDRKFISLMTLSSDGCVYETLIPIYPSDTEKNQRLVRSPLLKAVVSGAAPNGVTLAALDPDHVAVLGAPLPSSKECLSIWNTKFQTLQTSKELPQGTSGQLWCYGEHLFLLHGKCLTVVPCRCGASSLAGALGKLRRAQDPGSQTMPHFVNWEVAQGCEPGAQKSEQLRRILRRKKSEVSLQPEVPASEQLLSTIKNGSEKHIEVELRKFLAKWTPDSHAVLGDVVAALLGRGEAEPSFYPRSCLMQLLQTHALSHSLCPGLMDTALAKADVQMLQLCLRHFPDVPESLTCACLKIFLSIGDDSLQGAHVSMESVCEHSSSEQDESTEEQPEILRNGFSPGDSNCGTCEQELREEPQGPAAEAASCPVTPKRAALLNGILGSAYSETFLLPHLKDIPAQHVTIMDWICLLLDANFTVVLMIPEAKRLLINLYKFVKSQISVYSELNKIEVSFRELQKLNQEKNNRGLYSIEVLELF
ncbi:PREDICTED: nucleolar protein 11 isoform X2 [Chinchilla lanigera]|uniref:nucleolar protein 11 isoform X2 n=1 Tax=Chinchilla lanigera TaxID=34839 RepID=UPI00069658B3|nr:PREDICTED: nucleolar protein 11 isoform X2 [Chinchilla lanigera]